MRLLWRHPDGDDIAAVPVMEREEQAQECPMTARSCTLLHWSLCRVAALPCSREHVRLRLMRVADILCAFHVLANVGDVCARRGLGVAPPAFGQTWTELVEMRYLVNEFFPEMGD